MPIEIKELVIKATVNKPYTFEEEEHFFSENQIEELKNEIIEECMDKIADYLDEIKER